MTSVTVAYMYSIIREFINAIIPLRKLKISYQARFSFIILLAQKGRLAFIPLSSYILMFTLKRHAFLHKYYF